MLIGLQLSPTGCLNHPVCVWLRDLGVIPVKDDVCVLRIVFFLLFPGYVLYSVKLQFTVGYSFIRMRLYKLLTVTAWPGMEKPALMKELCCL